MLRFKSWNPARAHHGAGDFVRDRPAYFPLTCFYLTLMNHQSPLRSWAAASLFCVLTLGGAMAADLGSPLAPSPAPEASPATAAATPEPLPPASPAPMPSVAPEPSPATPVESSAPTPAEAPGVPPAPKPTPRTSIEIDLRKQRAYLLRDGQKIAESPVSSGRSGHLTPTGRFSVSQKDADHYSSLYGTIVNSSGRVVRSGADSEMRVPKGCRFQRAPMKYFLRFNGAVGTHAGVLPGYPASHGCVRMPLSKAKLFYETVEVGSPVSVYGSTPERGGGGASARSSRKVPVTAQPARQLAPQPTPAPQPARRWFPFWSRP
jgi:lipoprotein-anchoring transpeptidase ErfK/SrfK